MTLSGENGTLPGPGIQMLRSWLGKLSLQELKIPLPTVWYLVVTCRRLSSVLYRTVRHPPFSPRVVLSWHLFNNLPRFVVKV